jgi:hypothetical protein
MTVGIIVAALIVLIFAVVLIMARSHHRTGTAPAGDALENVAKQSAEHIFDDQFREELRNRGRLHFEKIIGENAMFLQQDLRLTTSQLNEYMKTEITSKLQEEFTKYEQSIVDAKELAVGSIQKTNEIIDEQRKTLSTQLSTQLETEKNNLINRFQEDMADIINHYVLAAIGNQIDLSDQLEYIIGELETNKTAIAEDIKNGA